MIYDDTKVLLRDNKHDNRTKSHVWPCGTLKCENASIYEKVARCEEISTLNVKIYATCEQINLSR